jgi:hypothetical protein
MLTQQQRDDLFLALSGTSPAWSPFAWLISGNDRPATVTDGVSVESAIVTGAHVMLEGGFERWAVTVGGVAAGSYTITINGTNYTYVASGTETPTQLVTTLAAVVSSSAVTAIATVVDGDEPAVLITSTSPTPPTVAVTAPSGFLTLTSQATSVNFRLWGYTGGQWSPLNGGSFASVGVGWVEQVRTGIFSRLAIEVQTTDGLVGIRIGPCDASAS